MAIYPRHKALKHRIKVARGSTGTFRRLRKSWKRIEAFSYKLGRQFVYHFGINNKLND